MNANSIFLMLENRKKSFSYQPRIVSTGRSFKGAQQPRDEVCTDGENIRRTEAGTSSAATRA